MSLTRANPLLCTHSSQSPSILLKAIVRGPKLPPGGTICPSHSIRFHDSWADVSAFIFSKVVATLRELNFPEDQYGDGIPSAVKPVC